MEETAGINNRVQLAEAEAIIRDRIRAHWMREGVTMIDPRATYIDVDVDAGAGHHPLSWLLPRRAYPRRAPIAALGPKARLVDAMVGDGCMVGASLIEGCDAGSRRGRGLVQPLAPRRLPGERGPPGQLRRSQRTPAWGRRRIWGISATSGTPTIGARTNIGAGHDHGQLRPGRAEKPHHVGAGVFIGSDTLLVAPVTIGEGAQTGAGSVVTKDVAPGTLVCGRAGARIRSPAPPRRPRQDGAHAAAAHGEPATPE